MIFRYIAAASVLGAYCFNAAAQSLFDAEYNVRYSGITFLEVSLSAEQNNGLLLLQGSFSPRTVLAKLFFSDGTIESRNRWHQGRLTPLNLSILYKKSASSNIEYRFEPERLSAVVKRNEGEQKLSVPSEVQNRFSMHLQLSIDAQKGADMAYYDVLTKHKLSRYVFIRLHEETISTHIGKLKTVKFERLKRGKTDAYYWLSINHAYLPAKIVRMRKGKVEFTAEATSIVLMNKLSPVPHEPKQ